MQILQKVKINLYLIIPIICIILWALAYLFEPGFNPYKYYDFGHYYLEGELFFNDPKNLYADIYNYMPNFAMFFGLTLSIFPFIIAYYLFYAINLISAALSIREINKILILQGVSEKLHRFIFLIIISNGVIIYRLFWFNQCKFIIAIILFFIVRRELQYNKNKRDKDLKYYLINYNLFIFAVGTYPFLVFFLLIYVFNDISLNNLLKKANVMKYCLLILTFLLQNILFLIYPSLIFDFFNSFNKYEEWTALFYIRDLIWDFIIILPPYTNIVSTIIISIIAIIIIINKQLKIEEKFSYFSFFSICFSTFSYLNALVIFLPLTILLFVPFLKTEVHGINFIKENKYVLIGLFSIVPIYFWNYKNTIIAIFPLLNNPFTLLFIYLRYVILLFIFSGCLLLLHLKNIHLKSHKLKDIKVK